MENRELSLVSGRRAVGNETSKIIKADPYWVLCPIRDGTPLLRIRGISGIAAGSPQSGDVRLIPWLLSHCQ
jgi:hypothetical protein